MSSNGKKAIRPTNRVQVGSRKATVVRVGKRKQGGAWVPAIRVQFEGSQAVRRVRSTNVNSRPEM